METKKPGFDDMIEDIAGVNLRGLRTIWQTIINPAELFRAAYTNNWDAQKWAPSLRVYLFLLAVMTFLQFMWAGPNSQIGQSFATLLQAFGDVDPELASEQTTIEALKQYVVVLPIVMVAFAMLWALLLQIWNKGTSAVVRIRLYFIAIIPGMILALFWIPLFAVTPAPYTGLATAIGVGAMLSADFATTYRGLGPDFSVGQRAGRAAILAAVNAFNAMVASLLTFSFMIVWSAFVAGIRTGHANTIAGG